MQQDYLFYDIEVFSHDAFVVFKDINKKLVKVFHNNFVQLADFIKGRVLVGFNNHYYDDKIMVYMLGLKTAQQIKVLNDQIIAGENVQFIGKPKFGIIRCLSTDRCFTTIFKKNSGQYGKNDFRIERSLYN